MLFQILVMVGVGCVMLIPCFYRDSMEIFEEELIIVKGRKTSKIAVNDLEEMLVGEPPDSAFQVGVFNQVISGGLKAISDSQQIQFGTHLPQSEIEYLHNLIIRRLTQHFS